MMVNIWWMMVIEWVSIVMGVPQIDGLQWNIRFKWMRTGGSHISGNLHITLYYMNIDNKKKKKRKQLTKKNWPTATNLAEENPLDSWWLPESWGYPQSSFSSRWDVRWHKPSILGTPIDGNHHINLHQRHRASHLHTISVFADVLQMVPYLARGNSAQKDIYLP